MNIEQLESYNLEDAVKFHDRLNPLLWDKSEHLKPAIRDQLLIIAEDFRESLGISNLEVKDITISGSNAAYTYTPNSDIDLHLIVDIPEYAQNEVYRELFNAKKTIYNNEHNITVKGIDVELYVQIADEKVVSKGIYSVLYSKWIEVPLRQAVDVDDMSVRSKYEDLETRINQAIKTNSYKTIDKLSNKIRQMRKTGLDQHGEFSPENLAFKMLRSQGAIKKLHDAKTQARSKELSLKELVRKPVTYGFGRDYLDEVGLTPDGTNPTTSMFTNEETPSRLTDSEIIRDFVNFCVQELALARPVNLRLRRDPEWARRNRTFGRYNENTQELEVAVGQRHIMDVLRTLGHELVHQRQNETRDVPDNAGEDGSEFENEANAQAGVLMRKYGKLHPELFLNDTELDENEPTKKKSWDDYGVPVNVKPKEKVYHSWTEYELEKQKEKEKQKDLAESSGYIPTRAEANDPRYKMALTIDVRPGATGKAANAFLLNTDSQGLPQELRPDGIVVRMTEEWEKFKLGITMRANEFLIEDETRNLGGFNVKVLTKLSKELDQDVDEGWKSNLAGLAMATAAGAGAVGYHDATKDIEYKGYTFQHAPASVHVPGIAHLVKVDGKPLLMWKDPNPDSEGKPVFLYKNKTEADAEAALNEALKLDAPTTAWSKQDMQDYLTRIKTGTKTKQDRFKPIIHGGNVKAVTKDDGTTEWDLNDLARQITTPPKNILGSNAKMAKSKKEGAITYDLTLPALSGIVVDEETGEFVEIETCPGAGQCKLFCYARKGGYVMFPASSMSAAQALNFLVNHPQDYMAKFDVEVKKAKELADKNKIKLIVRIHDAGDFFSKGYYELSKKVQRANPDVKFYFYSKMGDPVTDPDIPSNTLPNFSDGGARSREVKKVELHRGAGNKLKGAPTIPKDMFRNLFVTDAKGKYVKDAEGRTQVKSPEAWEKFKNEMAKTYKVDPDSIITYDQMVKIPEGPTPKWNVVVFPAGHGDLGATRKDVENQFLMFH